MPDLPWRGLANEDSDSGGWGERLGGLRAAQGGERAPASRLAAGAAVVGACGQ